MHWFKIKCAFLTISRLNKHHNHHESFRHLVSNNFRVARWNLYLRQITKPLIGSQSDCENSGAELSLTWSLVQSVSGLSIIHATKPVKITVANRSSIGSILLKKVHWIGYRSLLQFSRWLWSYRPLLPQEPLHQKIRGDNHKRSNYNLQETILLQVRPCKSMRHNYAGVRAVRLTPEDLAY